MPTGRIDMIIVTIIVVLFAMISSPSQVNKSWCRRIEKPRVFEALTPGWCICGTHYLCRCNPDCKEDTDEDICAEDEVKLCSNSGKTVLEKKKSFQKKKGGAKKREGHRSLWSGKGLSARRQHQHRRVRPNPRQVPLQLRVNLPVTTTTTTTPRPVQLQRKRRSLRQGNVPETGAQREEVCICRKEMVSRLEKYTEQLRNLNMMPEYHDVFEINRLAERTKRFNLNQNHEVIVNYDTRDEIEAFKRDVTKPGGMHSYIDLLLQLLIGKSWTKLQSRKIGKDLYGQVKGLCDEGVNGGLMALAVEGVKLYDFAMNLNIPEVNYNNEKWRESLAYRFAKAEGAFYKGCDCPKGSLPGKYNEVSKLLPKLGISSQTYKEANKELMHIQNPQKEKYKARILLHEVAFDVTEKNMKIINDFLYEDIILVQSLIKLKNMTGQTKDRLNLLPQFENIPICVNMNLNRALKTTTTTQTTTTTTQSNACSPNLCQNGGTCSYYGKSFRCSCKHGFKGEKCEVVEPVEPLYKYACEWHHVILKCPHQDQRITIVNANYGRTGRVDKCKKPRNYIKNVNCASDQPMTDNKLKAKCNNQQRCTFPATIKKIGEPHCHGRYKYLEVWYLCQ